MADRKRNSQTQMADINTQLNQQNQTLKNMLKVANDTGQTTNNIKHQLARQEEVITNNIQTNKNIAHEVKKTNNKANEMIRRNFCFKAILWIFAIFLFAANIAMIIYKSTR